MTTAPTLEVAKPRPRIIMLLVAAFAMLTGMAALAIPAVATDTHHGDARPTIAIVATDKLRVSGADRVRPGWTRVTSQNPTDADHAIELVRLHDGVTPEQFRVALGSPDGIDTLGIAEFYGGVDDVPHHTTFGMTVQLDPGRYVIFDAATGPQGPDGPAWFTVPGFVRDFTVAGRPTGAPRPQGTATVTMRDFAFDLPHKLPPTGNLEVRNRGQVLHSAQLLKLFPGATLAQVLDAMQNNQPPPGDGLELAGIVSPGHTVFIEYSLQPGNYVIGCFVPDYERGGIPHAAEGQIDTFTIVKSGRR